MPLARGDHRVRLSRYLRLILSSALVLIFTAPVYGVDPPHDASQSMDCPSCHMTHSAAGGAITKVEGNANLCQNCHNDFGQASALPFDDADQALPGPGLPAAVTASGFSHRWDSGPAGHVEADPLNTSTGTIQSSGTFSGVYAKTYTISITTGGDVGTAVFDWTDTQSGGASGLTTGSDVPLDDGVTITFADGPSSPSFVLGDEWNLYVRTDINAPTDPAVAARMFDEKVSCSACHDEHSQARTPFDPNAPTYGGAGTGGQCAGGTNDGLACAVASDCPGGECRRRHFQRIDNDIAQMCLDCHSARDVALSSQGSHPVGVSIPGTGDYQTPVLLPLDAASQVACMSCHTLHYAPTSDGSLARESDTVTLCTDCHTLPDTTAHLDAATGVLWPGGEYGSTFPQVTDAGKRGACTNCHQPHGWPDDGTPSQDYPTLLVEAEGDLCFTCHDGDPVTPSIYDKFNPSPAYSDTSASGAPIDQVHDAALCAKCHNPHYVTSSDKVMNPDDTTQAWTQTYATSNSYQGNAYWDSSSDNDPVNPEGGAGSPASLGPAVADSGNTGDDQATSGGTYTGTEDQTYTVTVSTGGGPGTAEITVTSTGSDSSGPTTVSAWDSPVVVGTLGATISFSDAVAASVGSATCSAGADCDDDTATSGGSYTGPSDGTYFVEVTTAGKSGEAQVTCTTDTGFDCAASPTYTWNDNVAITLGSYGVQITIDDPSGNPNQVTLATGEKWEIPVTAAANSDGVLTLNDQWTIAATAPLTGCNPSSPCTEPDYVAFCLACHDGDPPADVAPLIDANMIDVEAEYWSKDQHGSVAGNTGTTISKGYKKVPWVTQAQYDAGEEPSNPYAALQCTSCHDGHGSDNLYHLKTEINVGGTQMAVGGVSGGSWPPSWGQYGNTTYTLPLVGGVQQDHYWGAWCTFCHTLSSHPVQVEGDACQSGHMHGGGNF
jgi:predicted CXXCH cytochrome family protein